ncbi:unnamed protein product [Rotaria socialis]|uniref:RING-type E3 ubiquitin transferase n=2 Tax=Rotaria socialis TaxID=392032 RepID=A0A817Y3C7_9BILA|nr:unnamed protein product [Rotaria socialis]CAF3654208.1 unnamed protein product [Rotaria socialis]
MMTVMSLISSYFLLMFIPIIFSDVYVYNDSNKLIDDYDDQTANFGPAFPAKGLKGYVTTTHPENGCKKILPPPKIPIGIYHWIALIPRTRGNGSCEFAVKVQNAQNANFSAVIIYNYDDTIITMGSSKKNIRLPSTLITLSSGLTLISHYLYNKTTVNSTPIYHVNIIPEQAYPMTGYLIPIALVVIFSLLAFLGFKLVKLHLQRRRTRRHRLPTSALKQLKIKKFVKGDPWEVCAICLDDYVDGAKLRILPCGHAYHMKCIDPWLTNNRRQCPVCKRYVFPNHDNSGEENIGSPQVRTPTEQTPLVHTADNDSITEISSSRPLLSERRLLNPSSRGVRNVSFASDESSDNVENLSSSQRPTSANQTTTIGLAFDRPSSNSRRYGSITDDSTTSRVANFFVGSISGATDATNMSSRSIVEDVSDIEATNDDGEAEIHPARTYSEENPAYVNDEGSSVNSNHV